jgi:hypothetical protein
MVFLVVCVANGVKLVFTSEGSDNNLRVLVSRPFVVLSFQIDL